MGTGLAVSPFNSIVDQVKDEVPKVLINLENTDYSGYDFVSKYNPERLFLKGKCDDVVTKICKDLGWSEEFKAYTKDCKNQPKPEEVDSLMEELHDTTPIEEGADKAQDDS